MYVTLVNHRCKLFFFLDLLDQKEKYSFSLLLLPKNIYFYKMEKIQHLFNDKK